MFQFKQFRIKQDQCAMKVGTDGILLGAWTKVAKEERILDLGAGTGLLALMMAQKSKTSLIDAVEVDAAAARQCQENVLHASWADRIQVFHAAIQEHTPAYTYDLIISNPPFFSADLQANNPHRKLARQGHDLNTNSLIAQVDRLLSDRGTCSLILPTSNFQQLQDLLPSTSLCLYKLCEVKATAAKDPHRILLLLGREKKETEKGSLIIQEGGANEYTEEYKELTANFYLDLQ